MRNAGELEKEAEFDRIVDNGIAEETEKEKK